MFLDLFPATSGAKAADYLPAQRDQPIHLKPETPVVAIENEAGNIEAKRPVLVQPREQIAHIIGSFALPLCPTVSFSVAADR